MTDSPSHDPRTTSRSRVLAKVADFFGAFVDLLHVPRAFWFINIAFMIDSMAYFGMLTLMVSYLVSDLALTDAQGSMAVSLFTAMVTLFMIGFGSIAERLGVRRGLVLALVVCFLGRVVFCAAPHVPLTVLPVIVALVGLVVIALGEGILQPLSYAGIKQYTDEKTNSMGYGLIYAVMNLGIFTIGLISPYIRVPIAEIHEAQSAGEAIPESSLRWLADVVPSGFAGVNWFCTGLTLLALIFFALAMTKRVEARRLRGEEAKKVAGEGFLKKRWTTRIIDYFREGPFANGRFVFFVFMMFPVQTLFAHQWLTMPLYVLRAYPEEVGNRMEWIVNWINPGIIFFGVPIATALTRRANIYTLMIVGSVVSALPTFLLAGGPNLTALITYLVIFSVGEALWQPRFLQYAAELAPEGKVAQYMGLANVPWITVKMTTGLYSGHMLAHYCPENAPQDTSTMWLIYGFIAIISPIGLLIGRRWVLSGLSLHTKPVAA